MPSKKILQSKEQLEKKILKILLENPCYLPDLYRLFKVKKKKDFKIINKVVADLERKKMIVSDRRGVLKTASTQETIKGIITITPGGYGFVSPIGDKKKEDIFIPAKYIGNAMDGDSVEVKIIKDPYRKKEKGKGAVGLVFKIGERKRKTITGELIVKKSGFAVRPLNRRIPDDIKINDLPSSAKKGDWVKAEIIYGEEKTKQCRVIDVIGRVGNAENDISAIISEYNLEPPYSEEEQKKALELRPMEIEREDLTSLYCVTIDPHDAKDFDDAVSISPGKNEDEIVLGVHIADVAAWVDLGSWIDASAKKRGFTAYIPGKTLHMLPGSLTNLISLKADMESCFAHTVLMTIDKKTGFIKKHRRCHSNVSICKRLNFGEVEDYLKNKTIKDNWDSKLIENLDKLCDLYKLMRRYREGVEHFLNLETTEVRVLRDDSTKEILGIERKKQGEADCLVEEFMLAANSTVAKEMVNSEMPAVFRTHPEPEPEKLEEFSLFVKNVFNIETGALWQGRKECQKFLNSISGEKYEEIICSFFLRAMNRALYSEKYGLHYGLGKGLYLHFTSPIRRYSDLIVHQQLLLKDRGEKLINIDNMASVAEDCTTKEKNNDEAYYAANDRLKLHYLKKLMENKELEMYEGVISSVNASGMIADIPSIGLTAFIPIELVSGEFNKRYGRLLSEKGGVEYKPGDFVYLQLVKIDFIKGTAIFKPIQY